MSTLYEVSSLMALVMSEPNIFSQVLGVLNQGNQIDILSISGFWANFKYNNINAYVKKEKYIDINVNIDIYKPKTIENLSLGTYIYGAINISGYVLSDNETKIVTITETSPSATITFKYTEILGTITIKYIDNSSSTELSEGDTFTDLKLWTYSYTYKDISGYSLANDSTQIVELTDGNHDIEIKFKYYEGKIINSDLWSTSQFIDLNKFTLNYVTVGRYLGYRGVCGNSLVVYYNIYDENYNFIKMIVGYQYRKTRIPSIAKYVRVSFYGDLSTDTNVSMFYFELGTNLEIKNIDFEDTRTCAIATTTSSGLLINNVSFTRCGYSITPCPVDFEDGWQDCQDIYFMNSKRIGNRVGTADIIDNAGYNHVYENNDNIGYSIRYSVVGLVIRNNNNMFTSSWKRGYETGSKFGRIENNIINGLFNSSTDDNDTKGIIISLIKTQL